MPGLCVDLESLSFYSMAVSWRNWIHLYTSQEPYASHLWLQVLLSSSYASLWFYSCQVRLLFLSRVAKYALCISICWHCFLQNGVDLTGFMVKDSPSRFGEKDISKRNSFQGHKDILHPLLRSGYSNQPLGYSIFRNYVPSQLLLPV